MKSHPGNQEMTESNHQREKIRPRIVVIAGPTAVGKSSAAMELASEFGGEIVSADSMQVYRRMDIGTAKPSPADRARVGHRLIDVVDPDEPFNAALFAELARAAIAELHQAGKVVWVVGGTGLYIKALTGGLLPGPGTHEGLREVYGRVIKGHGPAGLHRMLKDKDQAAAARIHPNDAVRLMRALEVLELSGESIVERQQDHRFGDRPYECLKIGLTEDRGTLFEKIDRRCEGMIKKDLVGETESLLSLGYSEDLKPMQSLGYKPIVRHLKGELTLAEATSLMKRDTKRYAKRQWTWFRADGEISWHRPDDLKEVKKMIGSFLSG